MLGTERWRGSVVCFALAAAFLAGCNFSEPVVQPEPPPSVEEEPRTEADLSDLQGHALPDECLVGEWVMGTGDLDLFVVNRLMGLPGFHVMAGSLYFIFGPLGEYDYGSDGVVLRVDLSRPGEVPERFLKGSAFFESSGVYTTDTGALVLTDSGSMVQFTEWVAVKGSEVFTAPGGGPDVKFLPDGPLPYECSGEELVLRVSGPTGDIPMIFFRDPPG